MALCLGAVWLHSIEQPIPAALLLALAALMRAETGVLAVVLIAAGLLQTRRI